MSSRQETSDELRAVVEALRSHDRFLIVTHENPDGDALGSLLAMKIGLDGLGKDSFTFLPGESGIPSDLSLLHLEELQRELPADAAERVLLALDCANAARMGAAAKLLARVALSINVDHHHDNTRFGMINLVLDRASSTGEIVARILEQLGVELTREIAEPIYVALMTDTGRFGYTNTTPEAHDLAAKLLRAGVDPRRVFQEIYERVALAHLKLVGRAEERAAVYEGGRLIISYLLRSDFEDFGVGEEYAEGIIDRLRAVDGTEMAAMIREPPEPPVSPRRVSLRASHDEIDVSAIARKRNGGGHRQAAGFSSDESIEEIIEFIRNEFVQATRAAARA
jgi:bifunctional oligoribonuclease and PAP phosphatase NrnA